MKTLSSFVAILGFLSPILTGAEAKKVTAVYSPVEAAKHVGEMGIVEGMISAVRELPTGQTFLNFGQPFPNHDFTVVVFPNDRKAFGDLAFLKGKKVRVSGKIEDYRGKPQIKAAERGQIEVPTKE